ncbi:MAG: outer membrane lipoprotein carrier protein LolA [Elusimicrobia bacterium]|nr:outer membrane lipoprotein carrier protein LolA [Elusimicrobiota bacterium]
MQTLLAAALLAAPCGAAGLPTAAAPAAAPSPSTSPFAWTEGAPLDVGSILAHFEVMDASLTSLTADFSQTLTMRETGVRSRVEGSVEYEKTDRLRIEHRVPERQLIVSDGDDIWIWRMDRKQVIQSKLADWKKADPAIGNLMAFGSYARMLKTYDVALDSSGARPQLVLRPKKADPAAEPFTMRLTLAAGTLFPELTTLRAGGMTVETKLSDVRFNPPLPDKDFQFTPPSDADVFRDFKPPRTSP